MNILLQVKKRKYELDSKEFVQFLRQYKTKSNRQIADELDCPVTLVEHWFRTDDCQSIPLPEYWMRLKNVLNIQSDIYDSRVMEWITLDNVYEMGNRAYDPDGIAPTIKASGEIKIIERNS